MKPPDASGYAFHQKVVGAGMQCANPAIFNVTLLSYRKNPHSSRVFCVLFVKFSQFFQEAACISID